MALTPREREQLVTLEVIVDEVVEAPLIRTRSEFDSQWHPLCEVDVLVRVTSKRALSDAGDTFGEVVAVAKVETLDVALPESVERVEVARVEYRNQPVEFLKLVL